MNIIGISTCSNKKNNHARLPTILENSSRFVVLKKSFSLTDSF